MFIVSGRAKSAVNLKIDDLDEGLMGEITLMERYLMDSHDLIQTRGKVMIFYKLFCFSKKNIDILS